MHNWGRSQKKVPNLGNLRNFANCRFYAKIEIIKPKLALNLHKLCIMQNSESFSFIQNVADCVICLDSIILTLFKGKSVHLFYRKKESAMNMYHSKKIVISTRNIRKENVG